jgi:hypothetical protein
VRTADNASNWVLKNRLPYLSLAEREGVFELLVRLLEQEEKQMD